MQGTPPIFLKAVILQADPGIGDSVNAGLLTALSTAQALCNLRNLRHLTVVAKPEDRDCIEEPLPGLDTVPAAVSQLQFLLSLRLLGHEALRTLPAELCRLSR
jgi:hypothetical protein